MRSLVSRVPNYFTKSLAKRTLVKTIFMRAEKKQGKLKDDFLFIRFRNYVRWTIGLQIGDEIQKKRLDRDEFAKMMNRNPTLTYKWTSIQAI